MDDQKRKYNQEYYSANREKLLKDNASYIKRRKQEDEEYRERKRQQARDSQRRRREKHKQIKHEALKAPCADCGIELPPQIMDFDHVRGEKLFVIAQSYNKKYWSYDQLREEIAKCDVRCPNCHRLRHYHEEQGNEYDPRGQLGYLRRTPAEDHRADEGSDGVR